MNDRKETKVNGWSSNAIKLGIILIFLALLLYGVVNVFQMVENLSSTEKGESTKKESFQVTGAIYSEKFDETGINLTYYGSQPVNVSVYKEEWLDQWLNRTIQIGIMHKGDTETIGFWGYATWIEVIYNNKRVRLGYLKGNDAMLYTVYSLFCSEKP